MTKAKSPWAARIQKQMTREADHHRFNRSVRLEPMDRETELRLQAEFLANANKHRAVK